MHKPSAITLDAIIKDAVANNRPAEDPYYYMYTIIRGDLEMTPGKMASQIGHAFGDTLKVAQTHFQERYDRYRDFHTGSAFTGGAKVCMESRNANQMIIAYNMAIDAGIPCAIIVDKGHIMPPHFDGNPIITALGIGPCLQEEAQHITKRFRCIR